MQTQRFTRISGMVLAVMLTLLIGSVRADDSKLELKFCKVSWMAYSGGYPSAHAAPSRRYGGCLYATHCGFSNDRPGSIDGLW